MVTPKEIASAEKSIREVELYGLADSFLSEKEADALIVAAKYGVMVAKNYRIRGPRLQPRQDDVRIGER